MTQEYRDTTQRDVAEGGSGTGGPAGQPSADGVEHVQHDLAQTPGKFTDDASQATSGEGAVTSAAASPDADEDPEVPAAIARPARNETPAPGSSTT
ncbi:hypothetical protein [Catellatospora sichuanensis]|uniref:hypothetical protein n=1 Tax=Catellatospora sichuanensis TaxID=1969805 RepID=UPI001182D353|nr:hypothetical protein [Catellatospora sichuanensis]